MAVVLGVQWSGLVPMQKVTELPFFYKDVPHVHRMLDSKVGDILRQESEEKGGARIIYFMDYDPINVASKVSLRKLDDFREKE